MSAAQQEISRPGQKKSAGNNATSSMGVKKVPASPLSAVISDSADHRHDEAGADSSYSYGFHDSSLTEAGTDHDDRKFTATPDVPAPARCADRRGGTGDKKDGDSKGVSDTKSTKKKEDHEARPKPQSQSQDGKAKPRAAAKDDENEEEDADTFDATALPPAAAPDRSRRRQTPHSTLSSSMARVESFKSHGLSELSKQIRIAHAKNTAQASEIDRLERQLRILADLKGVSISELRDALGRACAGEAHADLRTQINKLRAELDAAELLYGGKGGAGGSKEDGLGGGEGDGGVLSAQHQAMVDGHDSAGTIATTAQLFEKEASDKALANLQLRVGELEEVEAMLRKEISGLYGKLQNQNANEATLTSKLASKEAQIEELLKSLQVADEEKERQRTEAEVQYATKEEEANADLISARRAQAKAEADAMKYKSKVSLLEESLRAAELRAKIKTDEANILQERLEARERDLKLKTEQYQSRSAVQDERIHDLEQQLSSLYIAFGMVQEDRGEENQRRSVLEHYLTDADTAVAKQLSEKESGARVATSPGGPGGGGEGGAPPPPPPGTPGLGQPAIAVPVPASPLPIGSNVIVNTPEQRGKRGIVVSEPDRESNGEQHVYLEETDETLSAPPACLTPGATVVKTARVISSPSPSAPSSSITSEVLASGYLLKRESKGLGKSWKRRYMVLRGSYGIYQLAWGDGAGTRAKGTIGIATGVSSVTKTKQYAPSHKYCFVLSVNPNQPKAPVFVGCASSKADLEMWMKQLAYCTMGVNANKSSNVAPIADSGHGNATTNQEMMDHQIAMRLSQQGAEFS